MAGSNGNASGIFEPIDDARNLLIILLDSSARMAIHQGVLNSSLLPSLPKINGNGNMFYVVLLYGDYQPGSRYPVQTVYMGRDYSAVLKILNHWVFVGGNPLCNVLHEGIAGALHTLTLLKKDTGWVQKFLVIINGSPTFEEFHEETCVKTIPRYEGSRMEELLTELKNASFEMRYFGPPGLFHAKFFENLERVYPKEFSGNCPINDLPTNWVTKLLNVPHKQPEGGLDGSFSQLPDLEPNNKSNAMEVAVRQFISALVKIPQNQRAEAIRNHLESPAFSAEYKQCVVSTIRQYQNAARNANTKTGGSSSKGDLTLPTQTPIRHSPRFTPALSNKTPIWIGRVHYSQPKEISFEVAAFPIPNPKSQNPQSTPTITDYHVDTWPIVLSISTFISLHSTAISKTISLAKLVELTPIHGDLGSKNVEIGLSLRNTLLKLQVAGIVKLGNSNALFIFPNSQQLIGMLLTRQHALMSQSQSQSSGPSLSSLVVDQLAISDAPLPEVITPDAILRARRSGMASVPPGGSESNNPSVNFALDTKSEGSVSGDLFNSLMNFHSDLEAPPNEGSMEFTDFFHTQTQ